MKRPLARRRAFTAAPVLATLALATAACSSAPVPAPSKPSPGSVAAGAPTAPTPARYFATGSFGAVFEEGAEGAAVPRPEHALVDGRRVRLDRGAILAVADAPSGLVGFRALTAQLGGGYLVWSSARTYHAKDFLGELTPVAELGPTAGVRPWFGAVLLRTDRGTFSLDLKTRAVTPWRLHPGAIDALAIDDKRGVTLDLVGRVRATTDGGTTWTDVTAQRGYFANGVRRGKEGELQILSLNGMPEMRLLPGGAAVEPTPLPPPVFARRYYGYGSYPYQYASQPPPPEQSVQPFSQDLAPDALAWAASAGVLLPGDRALVGSASDLVVLSTRTGAVIHQATPLDLDPRYASCQPFRAGAQLLLACAHAEGANVLGIDGPLATPHLEATFPGVGAFVGDDRGHLAFTGRCGRTPPSVDDFGARPARRPMFEEDDGSGYGYGYNPSYGGYDPEYGESPEEPTPPEKPPSDDKRICVRLVGGAWIEHRITGDDARDLYRWVLGDDGHVTALLLKGANPDDEEQSPDADKESPPDEDDETLRRRGGARSAPPRSSLLAVPPPPPPAATASPRASKPPSPPAVTSGTPQAGKPPAPKPPPAKPDPKSKPDPKAKPDPRSPSAAPPGALPKPATLTPAKVEPPKESLRLVRLDPEERFLKKGKWTHVPAPRSESAVRSVDANFWLEPDGSIRGWARMNDDGASEEEGTAADTSSADDGADKPSPIATEPGGRFTGVRISPAGKTTLLPLPKDTQSVLFGGRYALARAEDDDGDHKSYFETTDGGATWTEVVGPPLGDIEEPYDDSRWPACSAVGCVLSPGVVRVGWGSPSPSHDKKKDDDSASLPDTDPFPVPRLPSLQCKLESATATFPPKPPTAKAPAAKPAPPPKPASTASVPGLDEDVLSQLPPEIQEMIRQQAASAGAASGAGLLPGLGASASPAASPPASSGKAKAGKPPAPAKPPPPPPAEIISLRTRPQSNLGQLTDKSWVGDFVAPFDPNSPSPKHLSIASNGLDKLTGSVVPVLGDRGVELLLTWEKRRALLGAASPSILPFELPGRFTGAVTLPSGAAGGKGAKAPSGPGLLVALDEGRRLLVLVSADASRTVLRTSRITDPARGNLVIARRVDAPGAALVSYSTTSGDVLAGPVDLGRAEVGPLVRLASLTALTDGALPVCSAAKPTGPTYDFVAELPLGLTVSSKTGAALFNGSMVPTSVLVRATAERLCVLGAEQGGTPGKPFDLTATFGAKSAAVARSRTSAEDPTKVSLEKLSCLLTDTRATPAP